MKRKLYFFIIGLVLILVAGFFVNTLSLNPSPKITASPTVSPSPLPTPDSVPIATPLPDSYLIKNFPFKSQAPFANWDELHDEACEEAALILVDYYLNHKSLDAATMEEQIQKMVAWEIEYFGAHKDLTIRELSEVARGFYKIENFKIKDSIDIDDIKREVANGRPVIIPTAGRLLGNPYFRSPGPIYHMLVVIGYEGKTMIVQDIGTKRGDHYRYSQNVLFNAIHDFPGAPEDIEQGKKTMLVFE